MKKEQEIILDTDTGLIEWKSVEGWVGKDGRFYGKDKRAALYANHTHNKCDEGHVYKKHWINCPECSKLTKREEYEKLKFKAWDGRTPLALYNDHVFFFDEDDLMDYMYDNDLTKDEIMLVHCRPEYLSQISEEYWQSSLPEDYGIGDVSKEVSIKLVELNEAISKSRPASWWPTNIRTIYDLGPKDGTPM